MSKRTHRKQVDRARARRQQSSLDRRAVRNRVIIMVMAGLMVLSLVGGALVGLVGGAAQPQIDDAADDEPLDAAGAEPDVEPCPPADDAPEVDSNIYDEPPLADLDEGAAYVITFHTTCGDFEVELDTAGAPTATASLVGLARDGYYDGVVFHRVIWDFVIQAGDPAGTGCGQAECPADPDEPTFPGFQFEDELGAGEELFAEVRQEFLETLERDFSEEMAEQDVDIEQVPGGYPRGTVAMANSGPDTNGSQFFVAQGEPAAFLPGPFYAVLGHVVSGMDVVDRIAGQEVDPETSRPLEPVRIVSVEVAQR